MKKLLLLTSLVFICLGLYSQVQQIKIVSFTVKNQLPPVIDNWGSVPGSLILVAQKPQNARDEGVKLVIQIKANGAIICGNNVATGLPVDNFTIRTFTAAELTGLLTGCHDLKDGNYSLCAQFFNIDKVAISNEVCKAFVVETPKDVDYAPPTLISPENGKSFLQRDIQKPVMFRWTPLVPKPKEPITYRLKVWQLMQGQNGVQAMKANQPIITKDVDNITQTVITNLMSGPCKPPYLCDFIWNVQALNREGKPISRNNGNSEPYIFKVASNDIDIQIDSVFVSCCNNGLQNIYIKIKNNLANTVKITQLKIDKVNGYTSSPPISGLSPALPVTISGNSAQVFTGIIKCIDSAKTIRFFVGAEDALDNAITETEVETDTLNCRCDACDSVKIILPGQSEIKPDDKGNLILSTNITITPKPVKSIKAELVYFEYKPESEDCMLCNKDSKTFGNFITAVSGNKNLPILYDHTVFWNSNQPSGQMINNVPLSFTISMPPTVKCCAAEVKWCIRYVITFNDCTVCDKLVCYSYSKKCDCK